MRADYNWPYLSVGAALSEALLPVAPQQRARIAFGSLLDAIRPFAPGPLVCADTDLLFEPALALDPLRLLRDASRLATIVVLWPGIAHNGSLSYAIAAHTHYRSWSHIDLPAECVISL